MSQLTLRFDEGSLTLSGPKSAKAPLPCFVWDERVLSWRAQAQHYREIMLYAHKEGIKLVDEARSYDRCPLELTAKITPRLHQREAIKAWSDAGCHGVVSLPTGAGKTILAIMAIAQTSRPTLVVVPTLDLLEQWHSLLTQFLGMEIGVLGGGTREVLPVTVATYNSAALTVEQNGNRFGLLVCDECHHLPAPHFRLIGQAAIAPFRLGLSATVERLDGGEEIIYDLLGPRCYEGHIGEMVDGVLAPYEVVTIEVPLTEGEHKDYQAARETYLGFIRRQGISMGSASGWSDFIRKASYMPGGRDALKAHRQQKRLAQGATLKMVKLWEILRSHGSERTLVFTNDNDLAYRIGRELVLPVLTHQTKLKERRELLSRFREGTISVLVTSKVLNEGVDVPEASIGIVVSGSSGVREHVQRLGRILRQRPGKRAILYELVSKDTSEHYVKERRRQHSAYQGSSQIH